MSPDERAALYLACAVTGAHPDAVTGRSQAPADVYARQIAATLMRVELDRSLRHVGAILRRDPTTVQHAIRSVEADRGDAHVDAAITKLAEIVQALKPLQEDLAPMLFAAEEAIKRKRADAP